ncbi:MAG TPA: T9SS type A sorting domain-containing protein, partial [Cyclobacteriaceae bacterium]
KGPGVDALLSFPYVWKVAEKTASDTSAYVEVSYPDALTSIANPIVTREVPGLKYASMGARVIDQSSGVERVKSYSRGLKGTFTIAQGFPGDFVTDSLALVALYNNTNGAGWTNKTNWLTGDVETWFGVTVTGQSITAVNLAGNKLTGPVPDPLVDILALQNVNLANNGITAIPNFTDNEEISTLNVSGNKLEFGALEANSALLDPEITFNYTNQADLGTPVDVLVDVGTTYSVTAATEGDNNTYQWKRNGANVSGANAKTYTIASLARESMGEYICEVNNALFPGLTLRTATQKMTAIAKLSGKLFASEGKGASKGTMTLFKINETGKYDTTAVKNVNPDGSYLFEKIVVDDYQLVGFADTLTYAKALPTYYSTNTVYWEEAQTIAVNSNLNDLNVVSAYVPTEVPKGVGIISGYFEEPEIPGGRGEAAKRVSGAGASVRRIDNVARPLAEKLTLVAYVFTNEDGEFELPELPNGDYRLNIQYPGYPMDKATFIDMTIGDGLESQVRVAANVEDNKIKVTKLVITGVWEKTGINVQVYPNPSADHVMLRFNEASATRSVELVNMLSVKLTSQAAMQKENSMNVSQYPAGMYLLHVKERGEVVKTVRIAIE